MNTITIKPLRNSTAKKGGAPIRAFLFDTYGTVCDFYQPLRRAWMNFAKHYFVQRDAGELAIDWRNAYLHAAAIEGLGAREFRPLKFILRETLESVLSVNAVSAVPESAMNEMIVTWRELEPWPDVLEGLSTLKARAIIAPLSNGNFDDMVYLARHAKLPWDIILGSSVARAYKPHPDIYLKSVAALGLQPQETCMVAAHQADLHYAAGHGMQTAFVTRPQEFGGATRPEKMIVGVDFSRAAEIFAEAEWTFVAQDFIDLAAQFSAIF